MKTQTNYELREIIENSSDPKEKQVAWEQLLKQNPSNYDLRYIIRYTDLKQVAGEQLLKNLGVTEKVDEEALIKQIAETVLNQPCDLDMGHWHCGTSHCLAGWATIINPVAADIEKRTDTETAGFAVLPNYAHLFYSDNDTVIKLLSEKINQTPNN